MYDLFRSQERWVRIVLVIVLVGLVGVLMVGGLIVASMLLYLVPSYNTGSIRAEGVVAEVAGTKITEAEVRQLIEHTLKARQIPPEVVSNSIPMVVDQMITDRALEYEAGHRGLRATDRDVAAAIREVLPQLFPDGKFAGKEAYATLLAQNDMTIAQFETAARRELLIKRLMDPAIEGSVVSEREVDQAYKERNEKIKIQYVKLVPDRYRKESEPSPAEMQSYFAANANQFQVPAQRNLAILYLDPAQLAESLTPSDNDLQSVYKQNLEQFRVGERVKVRHILLKTQGKPAAGEPKIKAQADDILRQVRGGSKFADLVEKFSEDPGSKANAPNREPGLGPGEYWVDKSGAMVPEFQNAAFALKPGQSDLVKTTYGYHVFQVVEHQDARLKPFDEVRAEVVRQWRTQGVAAIEQAIADRADKELRTDPIHPEKVAAALKMQVIRANNWSGQSVPGIGVNPDFEHSVESLKLNEVSPTVALPGNKLAVAVVTAVIPARPQTFEEAQGQVRGRMMQDRLTAAIRKHAQELYDKANAMNGDLEAVAKSLGLAVKTSEPFTRSDAIRDLDSATHFSNGFSLPDGTVFGPIPLNSDAVVAKVIAHISADESELAAQHASIRNELFKARVVSELERKGIIKRHKEVIDRLVAAYAAKG
jgi:peptidyl-prolyl cis-trans isomerase D